MKKLCFAALMLILAGCAQSQGVKISADQLSGLTVGKTSIEDIKEKFGQPTSTLIYSDGTTTLGYNYIPPSSATAFPFLETVSNDDTDRKQTVSLVFFNGVLKSYHQTIAPPASAPPKP